MGRRRIPRAALVSLIETCKFMSMFAGKPADELLKEYLNLMDKYAVYFFSEPWPENYEYKRATSFTEVDEAFLSTDKEGFEERFQAVLLKKNIHVNGFQGPIGMMWTQQAYNEKYVTHTERDCSNAERSHVA